MPLEWTANCVRKVAKAASIDCLLKYVFAACVYRCINDMEDVLAYLIGGAAGTVDNPAR